MLTPVDVQNKVFKGGIGFDKKDVESFMSELASDYGMLYRSNVELKDKVATLDESLQHYRSIEESMQKALTLSEKTAEETIIAANDKARQINTEAEKKAEALLADAKAELQETKDEIFRLQQQQAKFKEQFTKVLEGQLKMMDGEIIDIDLGPGFEPSQNYDSGFGNYSGGGLGSEGGLGGGYVGSNSFDDGRERTNQDPAINRGSLNMDPFADAMNGGGRFSRQTGGAYTGNSNKKKTASKNNASKSTLNVKDVKKPGADKVRKNFNAATKVEQTTHSNSKNATSSDINTKHTNNNTARVVPEPTKQNAAQTDTNTVKTAVEETVQSMNNIQAQQASFSTQTHETVTEQAKNPQTAAFHTESPQPTPVHTNPAVEEEAVQVTGEVEERVNESNMLDSEDNYSDGFDFVSEDDAAAASESQSTAEFFDEDTMTGEVEDKVNEATMLDSEDNYNTGFDFVSEEDESVSSYDESNIMSSSQTFAESDEDAYSGEVEDKINEATMLDSEDNYSDGFDFVVGNEEDDEIPTILSNFAGGVTGDSSLNSESSLGGASLNFDSGNSGTGSLHIDPFHDDSEDVFEGDVEDNVKQTNLIGNADDDDEGFNFL